MGKWLIAQLTAVAFLAGLCVPAAAEGLVYDFLGGVDGAGPAGGLVSNDGATFYGTTQFHGIFGCGSAAQGCGTIYQLTERGAHTVLYRFTGTPDGYGPLGALVIDQFGTLYGTTQYGGVGACANTNPPYLGCGTVFALAPPTRGSSEWTETVLYNFCSAAACGDGAFPSAGLVQDGLGALYGTVNGGGAASGSGAAFKLTPPRRGHGAWHLETLYVFCAEANCADGQNPNSRLSFDASGNLYGTTTFGGANGQGSVYELTPPANGKGLWSLTTMYSFCAQASCADGQNPLAGVVLDQQGALYGTTTGGGSAASGLVYRLAPAAAAPGSWHYTVLHSFDGADGNFPKSDLVFDAAGALYGSASFGGIGDCNAGCGTLFQLQPPARRHGPWTFAMLHAFDAKGAGTDGTTPEGSLIFAKTGVIFGTTSTGGTETFGAVYRLPPPVQ